MNKERKYLIKVCFETGIRKIKLIQVSDQDKKNRLDFIRKEINCQTLDYAEIPWLKKCGLYVDDCGAMSEDAIPTFYRGFGFLFGDFIIFKTKGEYSEFDFFTLEECEEIGNQFKNSFNALNWTPEFLEKQFNIRNDWAYYLYMQRLNIASFDHDTKEFFTELNKLK